MLKQNDGNLGLREIKLKFELKKNSPGKPGSNSNIWFAYCGFNNTHTHTHTHPYFIMFILCICIYITFFSFPIQNTSGILDPSIRLVFSNLLEWLIDHKETLCYVYWFIIKNILKDANEQPGAEARRAQFRRGPSRGGSCCGGWVVLPSLHGSVFANPQDPEPWAPGILMKSFHRGVVNH